MKKPTPKTISYLDWNECRSFIEKKYKINLHDYSGWFQDESKPFRNFWHYICETQNPSNGSMIYFNKYDLEDAENWQKEILEHIMNEFGKGLDRECEFRVEW